MSPFEGVKMLLLAHPVFALLPILALLLASTSAMALQCQRGGPLLLDSVWMKVIWFFGGMPVVNEGGIKKNLFQRHAELFPKSPLRVMARASQALLFVGLICILSSFRQITAPKTLSSSVPAQTVR
jgi:hypothetical protein